MKILLLILAVIIMWMLDACTTDDCYIIIGCGGPVEESEYFKEQPKQETHKPESDQNEIMKPRDPGIH